MNDESIRQPPSSGLRPSVGSGPIARQRRRATEPPAASRPIPVTVPSAGARGSRCRIIGGVTAVKGRPGCLHASEVAQGDRVDPHPEDRGQALALTLAAIVQGSPHASGQIGSQGASRTDRLGKGPAQSGPRRRSSRVHGCPISLRGSEHVRSQGIVPDSPTKNLIFSPLHRARASVRR